MKADEFRARFAPSRLDLPSWLPEPIAECIRAAYAASVEAACGAACRECGYFHDFDDDGVPRKYFDELIRDDTLRASIVDFVRDELADMTARYLPLACDHRMERVWRQLRRQSSGAFLRPACGSSAANAKERRDAAVLELFNTALVCRQRCEATTTRREIEQQRDRFLAKANELRGDARIMLDHVGLSFDMKRPLALETAAQAYEDDARELYATRSALALQRKHDGRSRWVALTIGHKFRALFGSPMYGLTATITSVVLGRRIKLGTVRQWLASGPKTMA